LAVIETAFAHKCHALAVVFLGHDGAGPHTAATHGASNNWKGEFFGFVRWRRQEWAYACWTITFSARDAPPKRTPHHAGYGDGGAWSGAVGEFRANIVLQCALRIWSKVNTFQIVHSYFRTGSYQFSAAGHFNCDPGLASEAANLRCRQWTAFEQMSALGH